MREGEARLPMEEQLALKLRRFIEHRQQVSRTPYKAALGACFYGLITARLGSSNGRSLNGMLLEL
jgi:hypothetical protein